MTDTARALLAVLRDLGPETLAACYGVQRADEAPFDVAYFAWLDAGCPEPGDTPETVGRVRVGRCRGGRRR